MTTANGKPPNGKHRDAIGNVTTVTTTAKDGTHTETVDATAPKKASPKKTWRDWMPPGTPEPARLLTRDELAAKAAYYNIDVDVRDLRFWAKTGVLPYPVMRHHGGTMKGFYPERILYLIRLIRQFQSEGLTLDQIAPRIRQSAHNMFDTSDPAITETRHNLPFWQFAVGAEDVEFPSGLSADLVDLGRRIAGVTGVPTSHVNVIVVAADGAETRFTVPVSQE